MANRGDSYRVSLEKAHLEWGTHRYTDSRGKVYGEGYIRIPSSCAHSFNLLNENGTNHQDILGLNIFNCKSADGLYSGQLKAQGCNEAGDPHAKQFSGYGNLKALGSWYAKISASIGDVIEVTFLSETDIMIEKI